MPPGTLVITNTFLGNSPSPISKLDADFTGIKNYINNREITNGLLAARPAAGTAGAWYFATDVAGGTLYTDNGSAWVAVAPGVTGGIIYTDQLTGLGLSFSSGTVLGIAAGAAASADATIANRVLMTLASAFTKTTAAWAVGTGNGGLATGVAIAATTWYHVFLIQRTDTLVVDVAFDTSVTGANIAANTNAAYTKLRRIGSFLSGSGSTIVSFTQDSDYFRWTVSVLDVNTTNPGTAGVAQTLASVPIGITVFPILNILLTLGPASASSLYLSDIAANNESPSTTVAPLSTLVAQLSEVRTATLSNIRTDTLARIRYNLTFSDASTIVRMVTVGWIDRRGRG